MIVVSDTSPIINLAIIGELHILPAAFGKIIIPESVFREITIGGAGMPGAAEIGLADWIEVRKCSNVQLLQVLKSQVDPGEAEAIALAIELKPDLLLIDERIGRQLAKDLQVPILGLLGVLRVAKHKKLISSTKEIMDRLIHEAGFRISPGLYREILALEGE
jgi:hypothetical protein